MTILKCLCVMIILSAAGLEMVRSHFNNPSRGINTVSRENWNEKCHLINIFITKIKEGESILPEKKPPAFTKLEKQEIEKPLTNCDFTSLYEIKDTVIAFDKFKDIIMKCLDDKSKCDQSLSSKTKAEKKQAFHDTEKELPSLALLWNNSTYTQSLNHVNTYFSTLGEKLATNILKKMNTNESNLAKSIDTTSNKFNFELSPTNEDEILKILDSFKWKHRAASKFDYLNNNLIVQAKDALTPPIAYICNLSFSTGIFPDSIKVANVIPILKSGDAKILSNYRPISILSFISKVIEKVVNSRLRLFLESNNILSEYQFGFRVNRTRKKAVAEAIHHITGKLESGQKCIGIFLDLLKAFDTVSRPILLRKMESVGIRGLALNWFESYLTNRKQMVSLANRTSDLSVVKYGLPQGSVLGPALFLIYLNDLLQLNLTQTKPIAYADDAIFIIHGDSWKTTMEVAQTNLDRVYNWLLNNLMSFNISKTKFLTFSLNNLTADIPISLKIRDCAQKDIAQCKESFELDHVHSTRYLGIVIDEHLNIQPSLKKTK